jgi:hypothetical protein
MWQHHFLLLCQTDDGLFRSDLPAAPRQTFPPSQMDRPFLKSF